MLCPDTFMHRLTDLYSEMDASYIAAASSAGFSCAGCDGMKCCTVDVTLHTFTEMHYLRQGFDTLGPALQSEILGRSRTMVKAKEDDPFGDNYRNSVCALNFSGLCSLYRFRPMICRLAGIPHFILRPDGRAVENSGCSRYESEIHPAHPDVRIDRSGFYTKMAEIEIDVVHILGKRTKSRTVAETLAAEELD